MKYFESPIVETHTYPVSVKNRALIKELVGIVEKWKREYDNSGFFGGGGMRIEHHIENLQQNDLGALVINLHTTNTPRLELCVEALDKLIRPILKKL